LDKALLVGLNTTKDSIEELKGLALALQIETVETVIQNNIKPNPRFYIGSGKVQEIKMMINLYDIDIIIFDDPLSPAQLKNLTNEFNIQVIDRSFLILSIFSERAQTKEAVLEVSLAQKKYMLPRLIGLGITLSRQGGGTYNAKGPGETKLELDRRKLEREISIIQSELSKIKKEKAISRKRRQKNNIPVVALVGYTNAGKSSLMNTLASHLNNDTPKVLEKDMLFQTLDTKAKRLQKDNYPPFMLIDTVGFINKLPVELVTSFNSTLKDVINADLLLHIVDGANFDQKQIDVTKNILKDIKASDIERILVLTKNYQQTTLPNKPDYNLLIKIKTDENIYN
jgi:GTP-binding protein HflX